MANEKVDIEKLIQDLNELTENIRMADTILTDVDDPRKKEAYKKQLDSLLRAYKNICKDLKRLLDLHIAYEKKNNLPVNLRYRRLYKRLTLY